MTKLLHYEITEKLGEGGMGVVYKAHDTRLKRDVAIKFLPRKPAAGEERQRFRIEAQAAAALNHPNIATIHAIEEDNGTHFIVMEYIEGHNLEQLTIDNKQLSIEKVIGYATQIAAGLQAAHTRSIIHRDIKASNIMVTPQDQVKITDFGLAKLQGMSQLTRTGATLGTFAYMSPEQASGGDIDHRSDIWSFGVVLYQALTGNLPFRGENEAAILYAILNDDPEPLITLRSDIPPKVAELVHGALSKNPDERPFNAQMLADALNLDMSGPGSGRSKGGEQAKLARSDGSVRRILISAATSALVTLIIYFVIQQNKQGDEEPPDLQTRWLTSYQGEEYNPSISPDGNYVAFSWDGPNRDNFDIYVKQIDGGDPVRITSHPDGEFRPAWSRDGQYLAFVRASHGSHDAIHTVPSLGGTPRKLAEFEGHFDSSVDWTADDKAVLFSDRDSPAETFSIFEISTETGERRKLTTSPARYLGDTTPRVSPDGKTLAFLRIKLAGYQDIFVKPLDDPGATAKQVTSGDFTVAGFCWAPDGKSILFAANTGLSLESVEISSGRIRRFPLGGEIFDPSVSLAKDRLVFQRFRYNVNIWAVDLYSRQPPAPLLTSSQVSFCPDISPDGKKVAFSSNRTGMFEIWVTDIDGSNLTQLTRIEDGLGSIVRWSPDGKELVFHAQHETVTNIFIIDAQGGKPRQLTDPGFEAAAPSWSRDGKWIYLASNHSGIYEVWKMPADGGTPIQVTHNGGGTAWESHDGQYIYYYKQGGEVWKMPTMGGDETRILTGLRAGYYWAWVPGKSGLYYLTEDEYGHACIDFLDFKTKATRRLAKVPKPPNEYGLSLSPDEKTILLPIIDHQQSDIALVDNFR